MLTEDFKERIGSYFTCEELIEFLGVDILTLVDALEYPYLEDNFDRLKMEMELD